MAPLPSFLSEEEPKWHCNVLKAPFNSFPPSLMYHGKKHGFYQFSSLKTTAVATSIRASWSTVSNWRFWLDFLNSLSSIDPCLPLVSLSFPYASPSLWDHSPFAFFLAQAFDGRVCHGSLDVSSCISPIRQQYFHSPVVHRFKPKVQHF